MTTAPKQGTNLLYALIAQARGYSDTIIMGRGDPDFDTPPHIIEAAKRAMVEHHADYVPPEGMPALRQAIADRVKRVNNIDVDPATEVVVTNGGQEALVLMVLTALGPGDAIIVPEPNYNTYADALKFARAEKISIPSTADTNFRTDPEAVRRAITDKTRALLLVSPNNPTATVIGRADLEALIGIAHERDLIIIADDIYDLFIYDDYQHISPASLPGGKERTLTLNALSKSFAMTGWRLGWIVGPADLMARVRELKAAMTGGTSVISQYAGLAALTGPQEPVKMMADTYTRRRKIVMDALDDMGIKYGMPQGGQFVFADISFTGMDSAELAQKILTDQHVLVYPGSAFDKERGQYIRMTFLQPEDKLREGLERMRVAMKNITG
ncbi:MAG: aminotransferase class I/II-fold pyridoxal phosphate-dependent enzyme [Chloroflexi bacterium]|uniref:pyridoxal phosphate-dependent aminotransferase n=1 Tax=Candidatus Flexifilum breve TaxID=3140694 RepID=UPI0031350131|nr:aminotransferase class I/II-fold pyridoxal phosphate-dependent enzyme [Chloroflexota bacterium]